MLETEDHAPGCTAIDEGSGAPLPGGRMAQAAFAEIALPGLAHQWHPAFAAGGAGDEMGLAPALGTEPVRGIGEFHAGETARGVDRVERHAAELNEPCLAPIEESGNGWAHGTPSAPF